ncbi:hypothetical protein AKJ16_DCAP02600 [Drosera capensis]
MAANSILWVGLCKWMLFVAMVRFHSVFADSGQGNSFILSSFSYPETKLKQFEWRYIRVELPPGFSSVSITIASDVELEPGSVPKSSNGSLPLICFREGSLPLPDSSDDAVKNLVVESLSNVFNVAIQNLHSGEACYLMQKNISLTWTNEQIMPGVWYLGLFNGIGPRRTQGKMIIRGSSLSFSANVAVEGCIGSNMWGPFCNQTVISLACVQPLSGTSSNWCRTAGEDSCHGTDEPRIVSLEIQGLAEQLAIMSTDVRLNTNLSMNDLINDGGIQVLAYVRYGSLPLTTAYDYSADILNGSLVIPLPKVGHWYIKILPINAAKVCYSLMWQLLECPATKAGFNCTMQRYMLQTVLRKNPSTPFESYFVPLSGNLSSGSAKFPLGPLLSSVSLGSKSNTSWTYFAVDVPRGAAGGNMHIQLASDRAISSEIYARVDGLPSVGISDYFYANKMNNSKDSPFFTLYKSQDELVDFYLLFVREGIWSFGIRNTSPVADTSQDESTSLSISLERCPNKCSAPHGSCLNFVDETTALATELMEALTAALNWYLIEALAEWVIFTSSGISSALYHACDVGTWCALKFGVLQFMDFWLSFMAVISTFVYMVEISEAAKRTIQASVSILTALMAVNGATRSSNIVLVIVIGSSGLLIGWLIEFSTKYRSFSLPTGFRENVLLSGQNIRNFILNAVKSFLKRFRWGYVVAGSVALIMAGISWKLETSKTYWIWHSLWHVSIFTSSFFFLCSKVVNPNPENQIPGNGVYQLTHQNSLTRDER